MQTNFSGAGVALITPFTGEGEIDFAALEQLVENQIENGTDYLVVLGTTAETVTLTAEERKQVVAFIKEKNNKRLPIVIGLGGNNTAAVCEEIRQTNFDGIDGILSVSPYYNKPTQEGIYRHFMAIADVCPVDIILYNVPGRTGVNMTAETTVKLAQSSEKFVAIKEASGDVAQAAAICNEMPQHFNVISGDDALAVPMISVGAIGVISVIANAIPKQLSRMIDRALKGDYKEATTLQQSLTKIIDAMFTEGNPAGVKAAMHQLGMIENQLRLPLCPVSLNHYDKIKQLLELV